MTVTEFIKFSVIVFEKYSIFIQYIFQAWFEISWLLYFQNECTKKIKPNLTFKYNWISVYLVFIIKDCKKIRIL